MQHIDEKSRNYNFILLEIKFSLQRSGLMFQCFLEIMGGPEIVLTFVSNILLSKDPHRLFSPRKIILLERNRVVRNTSSIHVGARHVFSSLEFTKHRHFSFQYLARGDNASYSPNSSWGNLYFTESWSAEIWNKSINIVLYNLLVNETLPIG